MPKLSKIYDDPRFIEFVNRRRRERGEQSDLNKSISTARPPKPPLRQSSTAPAMPPSREDQARQQFNRVVSLRMDPAMNPGNKPWSDPDLAPMEHEAFMRSWVNQDPLRAIPAGLLAPAGYQLMKALTPGQRATEASLQQLGAGYGGYVKGILDLMR